MTIKYKKLSIIGILGFRGTPNCTNICDKNVNIPVIVTSSVLAIIFVNEDHKILFCIY